MAGKNHIVIMAGGIGSRLWPISTPECPKQFIDVIGTGKSLIQMTVERFLPVAPIENFWVVTGSRYVAQVREQLPQIPESHILAEPEGRNTAPCIAYACRKVAKVDPEANVVVTPSDALVVDTKKFQGVISKALQAVNGTNKIVTIGITPTRPETGYGYICAESLEQETVVKVSEFKEKPNLETAKEYLAAGNYFWNAGIFVWNVATINSQLRAYAPQISGVMDKIEPALFTAQEDEALKAHFCECEKISIDYAVMEPASKEGLVYTHPADFGWSDLGNWASLHDKLQKDESNNGIVGNIKLYECSNCVVHAEDAKKVVLQGLDGYIFSEKKGQILVCKRSEEQRIREWSE